MKRRTLKLARQYQELLESHLKQSKPSTLDSARELGAKAKRLGLQTLDLIKLHEHVLLGLILPRNEGHRQSEIIRESSVFFAAAVSPWHQNLDSTSRMSQMPHRFVRTLSQRNSQLAAANVRLNLEITRRKTVEVDLKKSEKHYAQLLSQSNVLHEQLRGLSRQILSAQEEERKKISRELHDVIAQTLTGINVCLATLKKEAAANTTGIQQNIARTQKLVEQSVNMVHQFARELRPAVLDDLGLIPALHAFLKGFTERTGVRCHLRSFAEIEQINTHQKTALFRVAQEALTNVARHAKATQVHLVIRKLSRCIRMVITDNGKSFQTEKILQSRTTKHLGLLGMRERLQMVGGHFSVRSTPGRGTTIQAEIPLPKP